MGTQRSGAPHPGRSRRRQSWLEKQAAAIWCISVPSTGCHQNGSTADVALEPLNVPAAPGTFAQARVGARSSDPCCTWTPARSLILRHSTAAFWALCPVRNFLPSRFQGRRNEHVA